MVVFGRVERRGGGVSQGRAEAEGGQAQMVAGSLIRVDVAPLTASATARPKKYALFLRDFSGSKSFWGGGSMGHLTSGLLQSPLTKVQLELLGCQAILSECGFHQAGLGGSTLQQP